MHVKRSNLKCEGITKGHTRSITIHFDMIILTLLHQIKAIK